MSRGLVGFTPLLSTGLPHVFLHDPNGFVEPVGVGAEAMKFHRGEPLAGVLHWSAQGLKVATSHQHREEVQWPAEDEGGLLHANAGGPVACFL